VGREIDVTKKQIGRSRPLRRRLTNADVDRRGELNALSPQLGHWC
jgi:hypothetical protein